MQKPLRPLDMNANIHVKRSSGRDELVNFACDLSVICVTFITTVGYNEVTPAGNDEKSSRVFV